jgi:hypothetical protein
VHRWGSSARTVHLGSGRKLKVSGGRGAMNQPASPGSWRLARCEALTAGHLADGLCSERPSLRSFAGSALGCNLLGTMPLAQIERRVLGSRGNARTAIDRADWSIVRDEAMPVAAEWRGLGIMGADGTAGDAAERRRRWLRVALEAQPGSAAGPSGGQQLGVGFAEQPEPPPAGNGHGVTAAFPAAAVTSHLSGRAHGARSTARKSRRVAHAEDRRARARPVAEAHPLRAGTARILVRASTTGPRPLRPWRFPPRASAELPSPAQALCSSLGLRTKYVLGAGLRWCLRWPAQHKVGRCVEGARPIFVVNNPVEATALHDSHKAIFFLEIQRGDRRRIGPCQAGNVVALFHRLTSQLAPRFDDLVSMLDPTGLAAGSLRLRCSTLAQARVLISQRHDRPAGIRTNCVQDRLYGLVRLASDASADDLAVARGVNFAPEGLDLIVDQQRIRVSRDLGALLPFLSSSYGSGDVLKLRHTRGEPLPHGRLAIGVYHVDVAAELTHEIASKAAAGSGAGCSSGGIRSSCAGTSNASASAASTRLGGRWMPRSARLIVERSQPTAAATSSSVIPRARRISASAVGAGWGFSIPPFIRLGPPTSLLIGNCPRYVGAAVR